MKYLLILAASSFLFVGTAFADDAKTQYSTFCVACHGAEGKGDGAAGAALDPKPTDLTTSTLSDADTTKIIKEGGAAVGRSPLMAPWGSALNDDQIKAMVTYLKSLRK
mgnify:CR=1 FL=1